MPKDLTESVSGSTELVFPDDAKGTYSLTERSVYDAEEVRDELGTETPQYGSWIPVFDEDAGQDAWLTAPSQLRKELLQNEISVGERFDIVECEKTGREQSDPYRVELVFLDRKEVSEDQSSLSEADS